MADKDSTISLELLLKPFLELDQTFVNRQLKGITTELNKILESGQVDGGIAIKPEIDKQYFERQISELRNKFTSAGKTLTAIEGQRADTAKEIAVREKAIARARERQVRATQGLVDKLSSSFNTDQVPKLQNLINRLSVELGNSAVDFRLLQKNADKAFKALESASKLDALEERYDKAYKKRKYNQDQAKKARAGEFEERKALLNLAIKEANTLEQYQKVADLKKKKSDIAREEQLVARIKEFPEQKLPGIAPRGGFSEEELKLLTARKKLSESLLKDADLLTDKTADYLGNQLKTIARLRDENKERVAERTADTAKEKRRLSDVDSGYTKIARSEKELARLRQSDQANDPLSVRAYTKELNGQLKTTSDLIELEKDPERTKILEDRRGAIEEELRAREAQAAADKKNAASEERRLKRISSAREKYRKSLPDKPIGELLESGDIDRLNRAVSGISNAAKAKEALSYDLSSSKERAASKARSEELFSLSDKVKGEIAELKTKRSDAAAKARKDANKENSLKQKKIELLREVGDLEREVANTNKDGLKTGSKVLSVYQSRVAQLRVSLKSLKRVSGELGEDSGVFQKRLDDLKFSEQERGVSRAEQDKFEKDVKHQSDLREKALRDATHYESKIAKIDRDLLKGGTVAARDFDRLVTDAKNKYQFVERSRSASNLRESSIVTAKLEELSEIQTLRENADTATKKADSEATRKENKKLRAQESAAEKRIGLLKLIVKQEKELAKLPSLLTGGKDDLSNVRFEKISKDLIAAYEKKGGSERRVQTLHRELTANKERLENLNKTEKAVDRVAEANRNLVLAESSLANISKFGTSDKVSELKTYKEALDRVRTATVKLNEERAKSTGVGISAADSKRVAYLKELSDAVQDRITKTTETSNSKIASNQKELAALDRQIDAIQSRKATSADIGGIVDPAQLAQVRKEINEQNKALADQERRIDRYGGTVSRSREQIGELQKQNNQLLDEANKRITRLTGGWAGLNNTAKQFFRYAVAYGGMYELIAAFTILGRAVVQLEADLKNLQAVTASSDAELASMANSLRSVALSTKFSAQEISQATTILGQAGVRPEEMQQVLKATADFASAIGGSIEIAADLVTTFRQVYKKLDETAIADQLTTAVNISKLTVEDMKTVLSVSAQTAKDFGNSAQDYLGTIATLRNAGIKASTASTGLRQLLIDIFSANTSSLKLLEKRYAQLGEFQSKEEIRAKFAAFTLSDNPLLSALEELQRIGIGGSAGAQFGRLFEVRSMNVLRALLGDLQELRKNQAALDFGGAAAKASAIQMESLQAKMKNAGAALTFFAEEMTRGPVAALKELADAAVDALKDLTDLELALKAGGEGSLSSSFSLGAASGALLGAVTTGGIAKKIGVGVLGTAGVTASSIGNADQEETALDTFGLMASVLAVFLAMNNPLKKMASAISAVRSGTVVQKLESSAASVKVIGPALEKLVGFVSRFRGIATIITASVAGLSAVLSQMPNLSRWFGRLPGLAMGLVEGYGNLGRDILYRMVPALSVLPAARDRLLELLPELDKDLFGDLAPETGSELEDRLGALKESSRAAIQRVDNQLTEANEQFSKYKQYDLNSSAGIGNQLTELNTTLTQQGDSIATFLAEVGAQGRGSGLQEVLTKYIDNQRARDKGSESNRALIKDVSKAIDVDQKLVEDASKELTGLLNREASLQGSFVSLGENLTKVQAELSSFSEAEIDKFGLRDLADQIAEFSSEITDATSIPSAADRRDVLDKMKEMSAAIYEAGKKRLDDTVELVVNADESLGEEARKTILKEIAELTKLGKFPEVQKRLQELFLSQGKYVDDVKTFADGLINSFAELSGQLPDDVSLPSNFVNRGFNDSEVISDIVGNATEKFSTLISDIELQILEAAEAHGISARVLAGLIKQESSFNPAARATTSTARGLTQFTSDTADTFGIRNAYNTQTSESSQRTLILAAAKYLAQNLSESNNDIAIALAKYHDGPNGANANKTRLSEFSGNAQEYVKRIFGFVGAASVEDQIKVAELDETIKRSRQDEKIRKDIDQLRSDFNAAEQDYLTRAAAGDTTALGRVTELRTSKPEDYDKFIDITPEGPKLEPGLQRIYDTYSRDIEARDQEADRVFREEMTLSGQRAELEKDALSKQMDDTLRRDAASDDFFSIRHRQAQIETAYLNLKLEDLKRGGGAGSENYDEKVHEIQIQLAQVQLAELKDVEEHTRKANKIRTETLKDTAELSVNQAKLATDSAILSGDYAKADEQVKQYLAHQRRLNEAEQQRINNIEDVNERLAEQAKFDARAKDSTQFIVGQLERRAEQTAFDNRFALESGAASAEEQQRFAEEEAAGLYVSKEEQARRLEVQLGAINTQLEAERHTLETINKLQEDGNLNVADTNYLLGQQKEQEQDILDLERQRAVLKGQAAEVQGGVAKIGQTFTGQATEQIEGLSEAIGTSLVGGVNDLSSAFVEAAASGENMGDAITTALHGMFLQIATAIVQALLLKAILAGISGISGKEKGGVIGPADKAAKGGVVSNFAEGGLISGNPGVDTTPGAIIHPDGSKSPILVTHKEAILPAGMVEALGPDNVQASIDRFNSTGVARLAGGGVMANSFGRQQSTQQTSSAPGNTTEVKIVNVPGNSVVEDYLQSSDGQKVVLNVLEMNPTRARKILGG